MDDVAKREGRTVLFVSHNMAAINLFCSRALLLQHGRLVLEGPTGQVTRRYFDTGNALTFWSRREPVRQAEGIYFLEARVLVNGQVAAQQIDTDQDLVVEMVIQAQAAYDDAEIAVRFTNHEGVAVLTTANGDRSGSFQPIDRGRHTLRAHVPAHLLASGSYSLLIAALIPGRVLFDSLDGELRITVEELGAQASTTRDGRLGVVNPRLPWDHQEQGWSPEATPALVVTASS